jgi:ribosome biogenesis GTPase
MTRETLGWDNFFSASFERLAHPGEIAARVALEHRNHYVLYSEHGTITAEISGRMRFTALDRNDLPTVGDWVIVQPHDDRRQGTIVGVLERKSKFSRNAAGLKTAEQIVAANADVVLLTMGLDANFNLSRMERYLVLAWESGATPVVVLTKADLCDDLDEAMAAVESIAVGVSTIAVSATEGYGLDELERFLKPGATVALLGSSGVGKSTLINALLGEERQAIGAISDSVGKGTHTTTHRELILLPSGALLMDTPGMRELQVWNGGDGVEETYRDIEALADECRFRDCSHTDEPDCAVRDALADGRLDQARYRRYLKIQREIAYQNRRQDVSARLAEKERWKKLTKSYRNRPHR